MGGAADPDRAEDPSPPGGRSPATARREPTLRERKRAAARARVVDVALDLFARRGYAHVSVDEICAAAGVAPRSFFRYFAAKEEVLFEPVREMTERFEAAIAQAPDALDDDAVLAAGARRVAEYVLDERERLSAFFRVVEETTAVRASPLVQLAHREQAITELLLRRHGAEPPGDWRTRLRVARTIAAFRVWLEDVRATAVPDPLGHLEAVLAAR